MENKQEVRKEAGCLAYTIGGMSFIPIPTTGVLFGIITIIWGFAIKHTKLKIVGGCGIAFSIIFYNALGYYDFVQYAEIRNKEAKAQLTDAVQAIESYKVQNGHYPATLEILQRSLPANSLVFLHDATQVSTQGKLYYYKVIDDNSYHIRSYGRDGIINTADDVLPDAIDNVGFAPDYQVPNVLQQTRPSR